MKKAKNAKPGAADASSGPTAEELAAQKVQNAPLGLTDPNAQKKPKQKAEKTRYSAKPTTTDEPAPYLGKPEPGATAPAAGPSSNPPPPATGPAAPIPPGAQQP